MKVRLIVEMLNMQQHLSYLTNNCGVTLSNVTNIEGKKWSFDIDKVFCPITLDYFKGKCYNNIIIRHIGVSLLAQYALRHMFVVISMLITIAMLIANSMVVMRINVTGYDRDSVLDTLEGIGVHRGVLWNSLDYDQLEDNLSSMFNQMYTVVFRQGNVLNVSLIDKQVGLPIVDYDVRRDIVANDSGVITSISVVQGTLVVGVGQHVNKGDTLIAGVRTFNDGTTEDVCAIGTISATNSVSATAIYTGSCEVWQYTGAEQTITTINLAKLSITKRVCQFEYFDVSTTSVALYPLNIVICYDLCRDKQLVSVPVSFEDDLERLKALALSQAEQLTTLDNGEVNYSFTANSVTATINNTVCISGYKDNKE